MKKAGHDLLRLAAGAGAAAALLISLCGCAGGAGKDDGSGSAIPPPAAATGRPETVRPAAAPNATTHPAEFLPIARYSLTTSDTELLEKARAQKVRTCMAGYGLTLPTQPPITADDTDRRYGVTVADDVADFGYHAPTHPMPSALPLTRDQRLALSGPEGIGKPADTAVALAGHPVLAGGCQQQALDAVFGDRTPLPGSDVAAGISHDGYQQSMRDPAVVKAFGTWSACMKTKGFGYADPVRAAAAFTGPAPTAKEKKVAAADAACKQQVGLVPVWFQAETRAEDALIAPQTAVLAPVLARHEQQIANARAILGRG